MLNHLSMAYLLSNICTKNYWNQTTTVEIIVGGWVVSFFLRHSVVWSGQQQTLTHSLNQFLFNRDSFLQLLQLKSP